MHKLICKNCHQSFEHKKKNQLFCSKGCATSNRQKIEDPEFMKEEGEFKYYILGMIYSDGCISKQENKEERLTLELKDKDFIEKAKKLICPERKLYIKEPKKDTHSRMYKVISTNKESLAELKRLGVTYRKSNTIDFPLLKESFYKDFIRGYFDGNGSIFYNPVNGHVYKHISITTGSISFAEGFKKKMKELGFEFSIVEDSRDNSSSVYLKLYKKESVMKFAEWLYKDSTWFLQRKFNRFYDDIV